MKNWFHWWRSENAPVDLVVLGTSNCVGPDSFLNFVKGGTEIRLSNLSLGASSSSVGLYFSGLIPPTKRGFALLDYSINDNDFGYNLWGEARASSVIGRNLRTLLNHLRSANYLPIILLLPWKLSGGRNSLGERVHREVCERENVNFLNVRDLFREAMERGGDKDVLMSDEWHMSRAANKVFGRFLADVIDGLKPRRLRSVPTRSSGLKTRVALADGLFPPSVVVRRQSSFRSGSYGRLSPGQKMAIPLDDDENLQGLMVNAGAQGAIATLRARRGEAVKSFKYKWSGHDPPKYIAVFADIAQPICGGTATMEVLSEPRQPTEKTIYAQPVIAGESGDIEIEGALITSAEEIEVNFLRPDYVGLPLDLAELPAVRRFVDALTSLRPAGPGV
jgi:hypothetical protein